MRNERDAWRRIRRRAALPAIGVVVLVGAQLTGLSHGAVADTSSSGAGSAIATASVFGAVPIVGNTNLAVSAGDATASYQASESRSSSQTIDLGGLGVVLANTPVCGVLAFPTSSQPPPLTDDSDGGPATVTNSLPAGMETATATASPESASATTAPTAQEIPGLLTVSGEATSAVQYVNGTERQAQSGATLNLSLENGLVALDDMSWTAEQHSGGAAVSQGGFTVGSIKVGPLSFPGPSAAQVTSAIGLANHALAALGLTLVAPTTKTDSATGTVTVTPLEITLGKSALSDAVISPLISQLSALETTVNGQTTTGSQCANPKVLANNLANPAETVANVALGAFANGGGFDLDVGGVTADTEAPPDFADPFGSDSTTGVTIGSLTPGPLGLVTGGSGLPLGVGLGSVVAGSASTTTTAPIASASAPSALASASHCETTSPTGSPSCWSGDATVVGIVAVGAGAALYLADFRKSRRSRKRTTEEVLA